MNTEAQKTEFKLTKNLSDQIVGEICKFYNKFNDKRQPQLSEIKIVQDAIYKPCQASASSWQSQIELPELYELHQTLKSHLIENLYTNPEAMFDVSMNDDITHDMALKQKAVLVSYFEKMKFRNEIDKIVNSIIETGECIVFVGWHTKYKKYRRAQTLEEQMISPTKDGFISEKKLIFDGVKINIINSQDFVFDTNRTSNWESCPKVFRSWLDLSDIESDKLNNCLTEEKIKDLNRLMQDSKDAEGANHTKNGQLEIMEYWGDVLLDDGRVLANQLVTIACRRHIIRMEDNPFISCPFIYANMIEDPRTKRGISPLKVAVSISHLSSTILNKQIDALSLIMNPPYLAPKGAFKGEQVISPGKIIEYESALLPQQPIPLSFNSALCGWDFIKFFKSSIESATGIFKTMAGNVQPQARTATELNYSAGGQAARLNLLLDTINSKIMIPIVEKVADTIANFKFGTETVTYYNGNEKHVVDVDDSVRLGSYAYHYGDRRALLERKNKYKELFDIICTFAKVPSMQNKINWSECFKFTLEQYGIENSNNFLLVDEFTELK